MTRSSDSSPRMVVARCLVVLLVFVGRASYCHGLSLGGTPRHGRLGGLRHVSSPTMMFGSSHNKRSRRYRALDNKSPSSVSKPRQSQQQKKGSNLYGYLDKLDRQSGLNYNDYWGRKRNTTDIVDSMQRKVESTPKPFNKLVSEEMWYVSSYSCADDRGSVFPDLVY